MSDLFQKSKSTINEHIKNIYSDGELNENSTMRKFGNSEFSTKPTNHYNLDMIISVGYRVRSQRGVQFRIWASGILKEYMRIVVVAYNDELHFYEACGFEKSNNASPMFITSLWT